MPKKARGPRPETRTLFVRIPADMHRRLKLEAVHREVRVAELVREALDRYLPVQVVVKIEHVVRDRRIVAPKYLKKEGPRGKD